MAQPDAGARERGERGERGLDLRATEPGDAGSAASGVPAANPLHSQSAAEIPAGPYPVAEPGCGGHNGGQQTELPPGQYVPRTLPVLHYGPIPAFRRETWDLRIFGATESGAEARLRWDDLAAMPVSEVIADFHCVTKFTVPAVRWHGILAAELLRRYPPAAPVTHVMIWADFGYSANIRISDFAAEQTVLATHRDGDRLTPEHGYPVRLVVPHLYAWKSVKWIRALEYLTNDRRGFWEERGYHNTADPWREQRYSYQELDGEGPPL
jgi:DMSO/TMAO reductase YedYZ molybdopterin-dependent catalytic subunit